MTCKKETGLTLVEMLIALVLGLFVTAVIITVFSTNVRSSTENIKMIRLNQELRGVMTMMVDELKRTGHSADATNSDFMSDINFTSTCARYSYDEDKSSIRETDERFGFRLNVNTIEWSSNATSSGCTGGLWSEITDPNLALITTLDFDVTGSVNTGGVTGVTAVTTTTGVSVYDVTITLTGTTDLPHSSAANDPRRTITETVRIRNEDPKD
ncbi:MAG: type IV pilin [Cycloclasticus sp.]|nr:MAG: type IV pilin [Cycloclasticus sp.]